MKSLEKIALSILTLVLTVSLAAPAVPALREETISSGPTKLALGSWDCVPRFIRIKPEAKAQELDYIVTVFRIMATGEGDAGWGEGKLPFYLPGDESRILHYADFSQDSPYYADIIPIISYQIVYCNFLTLVDSVELFVSKYDNWEAFFCRSSETEEAYAEHVAYAYEVWGVSDGDIPSYGEFTGNLHRTIRGLMDDLFNANFYMDMYDATGPTGLLYIWNLGYISNAEIKAAALETFEAALGYQEALEAVLNGEAISFFGIDVNYDIW